MSTSQTEFLETVAKKTSDGGSLRGDYTHMRDYYVVDQHWEKYTEEEHELWRRLYKRQSELLPGRACKEFVDSLNALDVSGGIPNFERTSDVLEKNTGWRIVAVPGLIPEFDFFTHL